MIRHGRPTRNVQPRPGVIPNQAWRNTRSYTGLGVLTYDSRGGTRPLDPLRPSSTPPITALHRANECARVHLCSRTKRAPHPRAHHSASGRGSSERHPSIILPVVPVPGQYKPRGPSGLRRALAGSSVCEAQSISHLTLVTWKEQNTSAPDRERCLVLCWDRPPPPQHGVA